MRVVILAGGYGTRISEETALRPKPMVEIGGRPILWHIMKHYSHYGFNEFVICLGFKGYAIKEYFRNYFLHSCDVTIDVRSGHMDVHQNAAEPWRVTLVDTGLDTMTGGRLRRVRDYIGDETFMMTYGDGVSNVDLTALVAQHRMDGTLATVTAVQPAVRWGTLVLEPGNVVSAFREKITGDEGWVNGGFFVLEPAVLDMIEGDGTVFEREPLAALSTTGQLRAYLHSGFWQPMDTLRERDLLEQLWSSGHPPWKVW